MAASVLSAMVATRQRPRLRRRGLTAAVRLVQSRWLAVALLALVAAAAVSGTLLPQAAMLPPSEYQAWRAAHPDLAPLAEALGLTRVHHSPWFLALLAALFVSLLAWTAPRARQVWKLDRVRRQQGRAVPQWVRASSRHISVPLNDVETALNEAAAWLGGAGYRVRRDAAYLYAEKGSYGVWGSVVLHGSILVILAGGLTSGLTRMSGYFELAEGQVFTERREAFQQFDAGALYRAPDAAFQLRLDQQRIAWWDNGELREIASTVTLISPQGDVEEAAVSVEAPLRYRDATIFQAKQHGLAVLLTLRDSSGDVVSRGYVNFPRPRDLTDPATNKFQVPRTSLRAEADLYPAPGAGQVAAGAWLVERPGEPWLYVFLRDEQDAVVFQGRLEVGGSVPAGPYSLGLERTARWSGFPVVRDPGLPLVYAGFALCALGAIMTFLWVPKQVWVWADPILAGPGVLSIGGRADKFPLALAEEVQELAARLGGGHGRA